MLRIVIQMHFLISHVTKMSGSFVIVIQKVKICQKLKIKRHWIFSYYTPFESEKNSGSKSKKITKIGPVVPKIAHGRELNLGKNN